MVNNNLVGGWPTPLKNDGVSNSWDDDIPNIWKNEHHVPKHQPENDRIGWKKNGASGAKVGTKSQSCHYVSWYLEL